MREFFCGKEDKLELFHSRLHYLLTRKSVACIMLDNYMTVEDKSDIPVPGVNGFGVSAPDSLALLKTERDKVARELEKARLAAETAEMQRQAEALRRGATPAPDAAQQANLAQRALGMASGLVDPATLRAAAGMITDPEALRAAAALAEAARRGGGLPGVVSALQTQGAEAARAAQAKAEAQRPRTLLDRIRHHQQAADAAGVTLKTGDATKAAVAETLLAAGTEWVMQKLAPQAPIQQPQAPRPAEAASVQPVPRTQPDGSPAPQWPLPPGFGEPLPPTQPMPGHPAYRGPVAQQADAGAPQPAQPNQQQVLRYIPTPGSGHSNGGGRQ